jgi:hypothetical protein
VLGTEHSGRGGAVVSSLLPVNGCPLPVFAYITSAGVGEQFVKPCCPVMRAGRMKAHGRRTLHGLKRPHVRHPGQVDRPRDLVRGRAHGSVVLEVRDAGTGRQLGIPLMQIADSRVNFNGSPCPGGHTLSLRVSTFHLLVVSQPGIFHKGHRSLHDGAIGHQGRSSDQMGG